MPVQFLKIEKNICLRSDLIESKRNAFPQMRLLLDAFNLDITADETDVECRRYVLEE